MPTRIENARRLRQASTDAERRLWYFLRNRQLDGCRFRRQAPLGHYVADFVCVERRLVIELDGGQHFETAMADLERTRHLARAGYRVLRFWNDQVLRETNSVLESILLALREPSARVPLFAQNPPFTASADTTEFSVAESTMIASHEGP
jgi:very-short-patch-repair endonuclease